MANADINKLAVVERLRHEFSRFEKALSTSKPVIELCKAQIPDIAEKIAISQILHSFYCGIERITVLLLKSIGENIPNDGKWHKTLFEFMFGANPKGVAIIRQDLKSQLEPYMAFRHVVRQVYGFELRWNDMKELVNNLEKTWEAVKSDFEAFIENP